MNGKLDSGAAERLIEEHFRVETRGIHAAPDLWQKLAPRLGAQQRSSLPTRMAQGLSGRRVAAPRRRPSAWRYALLGICALAAVLAGLALLVGPGGGPGQAGVVRVHTPVGPTVTATGQRPVATPQPTEGLSPTHPPATVQPEATATAGLMASPRLSTGTLEEAEAAMGVTIRLPRYLPEGAVREDALVRYLVQDGRRFASVGYRVGPRHMAVEFTKEPAGDRLLPEGEPATVGGFQAVVQTQPREPSDTLPPISQVAWRDGEVTMRVTGDLPPEELLKVAQSLYP